MTLMKLIINEVHSEGTMMAMMDYKNTLNVHLSNGFSFEEAMMAGFSIPPIAILVDDLHPYKDKNGKEGWFHIKAISPAMVCRMHNSQKEEPSWMLLGYLERKKLFGLKKEQMGCVACPDCGIYSLYPKELIEMRIEYAKENNNPSVMNDRPINQFIGELKQAVVKAGKKSKSTKKKSRAKH